MPNTIIIKNSSTVSDIPTAGQLEQGELALNLLDEKLYSKNSSNVIFEITGLHNIVEDLSPQLGADLQSNGFDIDMADNDLITLGSSADAQLLFDGTRMVIDVGVPDKLYVRGDQNSQISIHLTNTDSTSELMNLGFFGSTQLILKNNQTSGTFAIQGVDSGAGLSTILDADPNGAVNLYYDGISQVSTQSYNAAGNSTGLQVKNHIGTLYDVGLNVVPDFAVSANDTFDVDHQSMMWHKNAGGAITLTCASTTDIPDGAMWYVYNDDTENLTIDDDATAVVYWLEGGTAKATGAITVEPGGIVTVYKLSLNEYWVWGSKAAGGGGGATSLNGLSDVTLTSPADDSILIYDTGTAQWRDYTLTGDLDLNDVGVTTLQVSAITGKTALTSGLVSTDELLVSDGGVLKRMDISVIEAYMQANLTGFGTVNGTGTDNYIAVWNGTANIDAVGSFLITNAVDKTASESISGAWTHTSGNLKLNDNVNLVLGTGSDVTIDFDATDFIVNMLATVDFRLQGGGTSDNMIVAISNAQVILYYNNVARIQTTASGADITGTLLVDTIDMEDNQHIYLGTADDADIYFDGTDLRIDLDDTYNFRVRGGTSGTEAMMHCLANGEFGAYYNGSLKITTTNVGVNVTGRMDADDVGVDDNQSIFLGSSDDIDMYFNATDFYIDMSPANDFRLRGGSTGIESMIVAIADAGVHLYHNGSQKFVTAADGIDVTGDVGGTTIGGITQANLVDKAASETISGAWTFSNAGNLVSGDLEFQDNAELRFGTDNDVQLFHNGVQLELDLGTDIFYIREGVTNIAIFSPSSGVDLYDSVGTHAFGTQLRTTLGNTSSATVRDHVGTELDIGFNTIPTFNMNVSDTLEASHCGHLTGKTNTTAYTLTGPASTDLDFPVGGVCQVANFGATVNYTISDTASCTMYYMDGAAAPVDIAGSATLAPGGWVTLYRYSSTAIYITGSGLTP